MGLSHHAEPNEASPTPSLGKTLVALAAVALALLLAECSVRHAPSVSEGTSTSETAPLATATEILEPRSAASCP